MQERTEARGRREVVLASLAGIIVAPASARGPTDNWAAAWPRTDFRRGGIDLAEIISGGPLRDGSPPSDRPECAPAGADVGPAAREPVIGLVLNGEARASPLRALTWHDMVNDAVGGVPAGVTYCPLCNTAIGFARRLDGQVLGFGTTGKLRRSDLVMYGRQTESWWQ